MDCCVSLFILDAKVNENLHEERKAIIGPAKTKYIFYECLKKIIQSRYFAIRDEQNDFHYIAILPLVFIL